MNKLLISTCLTALVAVTSPSWAQSPKGEPTSPPTSPSSPSSPSVGVRDNAPEKAAPDKATPQSSQNANERPATPGQNDGKRQAAPESKGSQSDTKSAQPDGKASRPDTKAAQPDGKAAQPDGKGTRPDTKAAQPDGKATQPDSKASRKDAKDPAAAKSDGTQGATAPAAGDKQGAGTVSINTEQRTRVQTVFAKRKGGPRAKNVTFAIQVGTVVPRNVTLVAVPQEVVVIVPQYRRYRYFIINDQICIVDPVTLSIIDIISIAV